MRSEEFLPLLVSPHHDDAPHQYMVEHICWIEDLRPGGVCLLCIKDDLWVIFNN